MAKKNLLTAPLQISQVLPLRHPGMTPINWPFESGYVCPVCHAIGESLWWSEYHGMLWCYTCQKDYPSCMCLPVREIDTAIDIFLATVRDAVKFATTQDTPA